jgi:DeoR/GlpR family transcriptional regulator of sugar metabolism
MRAIMETSLISAPDRQQQILDLVGRHQRISVEDICSTFNISTATARRDLDALAREGKIQRVHGGAMAVSQAQTEAPILLRQREQADEKIRIGQAAAELAQDGETIFLGSGTTVLEMARNLRGRRNLTIITNSLPVVNTLAGLEAITVICLGGMLRDSELSFIGHLTELALAEVFADKVFIGMRAISLEYGLTHEYLPETMTDRAILKVGKEIVVLADHTKFDHTETVLLTPLERIHTIVTDEGAPHDFTDSLQSKGIRLLIA